MSGSTLLKKIPNLITIGRLILVPVVIAMISSRYWTGAFVGFVVAGVSDAVDGFIAKKFDARTELGAYLDPLADKALLVSIYVALAVDGALPGWLAILVVSRDLMIVGAVIVSGVLEKPVRIQPLLVSKLNTFVQILLAGLVLATQAFGVDPGPWTPFCIGATATLTAASMAAYLAQWLKHMSS